MDDVWPRVIAHADMDAFFAAIEQLDDPALRGRPVLVGPKSGRGVVLTASYEARPYNVGSAMPMAVARKRCPDAVIVPPRLARYTEVSAQVMRVFHDFSPDVEAISLDEAFIDMSGSGHLFGPPLSFGTALQRAVEDATGGLTVSVGISGTKYVAKVASGFEKPGGLTIVPPDEAKAWLAPQPVSVLWGAGPKTQARLAEFGITTVGDLQARGEEDLVTRLGSAGRHFFALANGQDPRRVERRRAARSLSSERTLNVDISTKAEILFHIRKAVDQVGQRLRKRRLVAGGVRVKLRCSDFRILTRQTLLSRPTNSSDVLYPTASSLVDLFDDSGPFRLVGVAAFELTSADGDERQLDLNLDRKKPAIDGVLDSAAARFGPNTLLRARDLERKTVLDRGANLDFLDDVDEDD